MEAKTIEDLCRDAAALAKVVQKELDAAKAKIKCLDHALLSWSKFYTYGSAPKTPGWWPFDGKGYLCSCGHQWPLFLEKCTSCGLGIRETEKFATCSIERYAALGLVTYRARHLRRGCTCSLDDRCPSCDIIESVKSAINEVDKVK